MIIWIIASWCLLLSPEAERTGNLFIQVSNIQEAQGTVWVGIYDSQGAFLHKEQAILKHEPIRQTGQLLVQIDDLPYGTYAVALFHDQNNNGELDLNWLGAPIEPFAFSAPLASNWRLPKFAEVAFPFRHSGQQLQMQLMRWEAW